MPGIGLPFAIVVASCALTTRSTRTPTGGASRLGGRRLPWFVRHRSVEIKGTLQAQDLRSACWLQIAPRSGFALVGVFLVLLDVWALWGSFFGPTRAGDHWTGWLLVLANIMLFQFFALISLRASRLYRLRRILQREFQITVSSDGLDFRNENGRMKLPWSDFRQWKENDALYLLYPSAGMFEAIPKRFFQSQRDVDSFREMLEANVVDR